LQINAYAQTTQHVGTAGTLSTLIAAGEKYEITDLTLIGNLNGDDILFIREMAGRDVNGNVTNGKLAKLNLADANIVAGGNAYYNSANIYYTSTDEISIYMFLGCDKLTSITIPNSVTSIGVQAFSGCIRLKEIIGSEQNQNYSSVEGVLFNKEKTTIIQFPEGKQGSSYVIPNSVTSIGNHVFLVAPD
jgi:hypothetical protein